MSDSMPDSTNDSTYLRLLVAKQCDTKDGEAITEKIASLSGEAQAAAVAAGRAGNTAAARIALGL
jgi:hypothetical protein